MSGGFALRSAVYAALTGDAGLQALIGDPARVFDDVPPGASFPYLTFGSVTEADWSTVEGDGTEHAFSLEVWSRYEGQKEAMTILDRVEAVLHDASLSLNGHALINLRSTGKDFSRDPERPLVRGVISFRAVTEPTS